MKADDEPPSVSEGFGPGRIAPPAAACAATPSEPARGVRPPTPLPRVCPYTAPEPATAPASVPSIGGAHAG